jgi:predicted urease superfamily metal-dependent hydrolase
MKRLEGYRIGRVLIDRNHLWGGRMLGSAGLPEEALGGLGISPGTAQTVDSLARGIDGPVEVIPLLLDLAVRLIDAIRVIGLGEMGRHRLSSSGA